jgi:hypothetical protein
VLLRRDTEDQFFSCNSFTTTDVGIGILAILPEGTAHTWFGFRLSNFGCIGRISELFAMVITVILR